ncbi:MAG: hypothetical protein ABSH10_03110 [Phycisphaerae bacterium]|jgi:hypothetical protein
MVLSIDPILIEPPAIEPGWLECRGVSYRLYHSLADSEAIDYATPITLVAAEDPTVSVALPIAYGEKHFLAARAVSAAGAEEQNTHVVCCVEVDQAGRLLPPPSDAVSDLTAVLGPEGLVTVSFTYRPSPPYAAAERFEVLSDRGTGTLDPVNPVATVAANPSADYEATVPADVLPAMFAVRAVAGGRSGPTGSPVTVTAPQPDALATLS